MSKAHNGWVCPFCKKQMSDCAVAWTSHCRYHVRRGEMRETSYTREAPNRVGFEVVKQKKTP